MVLLFTSAVGLIGAVAFGGSDAGAAAQRNSNAVVETGEGIPPGIPSSILRRSFERLEASAAGRRYLKTPRGRRYAGEVRGYLAAGGDAPSGEQMWCWDHECDPSEEYYFNVDGSWSWNDGGGADGHGYYGGCKTPWVRKVFRNKFGIDLWSYNQSVGWCWSSGRITQFWRNRWIWRSGHYLNGWSFHGHINTNCSLENCNGRGSGTGWTSAWTQGKWQMCVVRWGWCNDNYPLIGIAVNGWGGWGGFYDHPIG